MRHNLLKKLSDYLTANQWSTAGLCQSPGVKTLSLVAGCILLASCGGSGGGSGSGVDPVVELTSTEDLKESAAQGIGGSLDAALDGVSRVTLADGASEDPASSGVGGVWNDDTQNLVNTSLALGTEENTTRDGARITIDPDNAAVCSEQFVDMNATQAEFERCLALVDDMLVQLDVTSDTEGTLTYLFQNQPLVVLGYSPVMNSFELNLGTLKLLIDAEGALNPDVSDDSPLDTIQGAIRIVASATNQSVGSEAGSVALQVSEAINIVSADAGTSLSLGNGTLLSLAADAAADSATIEIALGALQASGEEDGQVSSIDMKGLSASIDVVGDSDVLTVRNVGIGQGPLKVSLNNSEVMNMGLDTFGFNVSNTDGVITLDGALDFSLFVREILDDDTVSDNMFRLLELTAPAGTEFIDQAGVLMVNSGGPVQYSLTSQDEDGNQMVDQLTVVAGQCADDVGEFDTDMELVGCL